MAMRVPVQLAAGLTQAWSQPARSLTQTITRASVAPQSMLHEYCFKDMTYKFLSQKGVSFIGTVDNSARLFRERGVATLAKSLGWSFKDLGDVTVEDHLTLSAARGGQAACLLHDTVKREATRGNFVLTVGADLGISSATATGVQGVQKDLCVLCVGSTASDAIATPRRMIEDQRIAYVAIRDIDKMEQDKLQKMGVISFTIEEVDKWGIDQVIDRALHRINPRNDRPVHLSFDMDGCDDRFPQGSFSRLTFEESRRICEALAETRSLCSMDLLGANGDKASLGIELIGHALGRIA